MYGKILNPTPLTLNYLFSNNNEMNNNYQEKNTKDKKILLNLEYIVRPVIRKIEINAVE